MPLLLVVVPLEPPELVVLPPLLVLVDVEDVEPPLLLAVPLDDVEPLLDPAGGIVTSDVPEHAIDHTPIPPKVTAKIAI